ncbi:alpha/beta fold hydrolase [Mycobacterium sp. 852002-51057_SCH5723018]|uniref:alpha/beta fold hydrolase n=1 Tax=Mycobacterium sp. 852002-51057_SCH5723018 TaxID=1834094 RepID=UPI0007FECD92|nr:alpha/beta hydrolase [Mycobacterium sp. 852002-51057_SCH5723018]OBG27540.1 epoxide hydrolase [Mycobacterium sp. 852002-51057_SCH5723018]
MTLTTWDVDGRKVFGVAAGSGEPVLMLHGYPQSASCWRHVIGALAENHYVVAPDWPGFGRSDPPATAPTYDNEIDRLERFVQRLGWRRFNLCAHDYGGFIGLGYVIRHPERVQRLALLNTRAHGIFRPWFYRFSLGQHWAATQPVVSAAAQRLPLAALHHIVLARYRSIGCFDTALEAEYLGWMNTPQGRRTFWEFFAHYSVPAIGWLADGLATISCPAAVIWGDRDPYIPFDTARELADRMPDARLIRLPGADHYVMEERPREVTDALLSLLGVAAAPSL